MKFCKDCLHFKDLSHEVPHKDGVSTTWIKRFCTRPRPQYVDLVTGEKEPQPPLDPTNERFLRGELNCGPTGRFFQPIIPEPVPPHIADAQNAVSRLIEIQDQPQPTKKPKWWGLSLWK